MVEITLWFTAGTLGMLAGTVLLAYGLFVLPEGRRRLFAGVVAVPGIAAVAYALMALGVGGLETVKGTTVYAPRYVDWLLTTPIHVVVVALLVGAPTRTLYRLVVLQALTIVFGFLGATLAAPLNWLLYLSGAACFGGVVYVFYTDLEALAVDRSDEAESLFRKLRAFVVVLWLVYPVIWVVGPAALGVMDAETTALVVTYIDVVSKVGFGLIAFNDFVTMAAVDDALPDNAAVGLLPSANGDATAD